MTEQQIIDLINQEIATNGNNEITALVLNPILIAMIEQPNDVIGDLADLDTTDKSSVVDAINEVLVTASSGFNIYTGVDNPNTVPPSGFSIGDWYVLNDESAIWQYNGSEWVLLEPETTTLIRFNVNTPAIASGVYVFYGSTERTLTIADGVSGKIQVRTAATERLELSGNFHPSFGGYMYPGERFIQMVWDSDEGYYLL